MRKISIVHAAGINLVLWKGEENRQRESSLAHSDYVFFSGRFEGAEGRGLWRKAATLKCDVFNAADTCGEKSAIIMGASVYDAGPGSWNSANYDCRINVVINQFVSPVFLWGGGWERGCAHKSVFKNRDRTETSGLFFWRIVNVWKHKQYSSS